MSLTPPTKAHERVMPPPEFTLDDIEAEVADNFKQHSADDIERNSIVRTGLHFVLKMKWLCEQLRKQQPSDAPPSEKKAKAA